MTPRPRSPRGRTPHLWLDATAVRALPTGTILSIEPVGRHTARLRGRITATTSTHLQLQTPTGEQVLPLDRLKRARLVPDLFEPADPVVRRGVPETTWRGGVVRSEAHRVLVETLDGTAWWDEDELEPAEVRDPRPPALPRGPVPAAG